MTDSQRPRSRRAGPVARFLNWLHLKNYQYEVTFSLYMLTTTEKIVFNSILFVLVSLLLTAAYFYLPNHVMIIYRRILYYISGEFTAHYSEATSHSLNSLLKTTKEVVVSQTVSSIVHDATVRARETIGAMRDEL